MSGRYVSLVLESDLSPDLKFTAVVLASFADEEGYRIWPAIDHVAHLRGVSGRQVQRCVKELCRMNILDVVRPATQWHPTHYRMVREHLPPREPYRPPDRQQNLLGPPGESGPLYAPGVTSPLEGESPRLPLIVAPTRRPGHEAHAWCGRICVPKFLHKQFKQALGGPVSKRAARMRTFYAETIAAMPVAHPIGEEPVRFWRRAFAGRFGGVAPSRETRRSASGYPSDGRGNCPHEPMCARARECTERTIAEARAERQAQSG